MKMTPLEIAARLSREAGSLRFPLPVSHVYNPLDYAWTAHAEYLRRYAEGPREILLIGMNPGPFGMAQTGIPFGDVVMVREWLEISMPIGKPENEHPRRPVLGFDCPRREVSGSRLWGWIQQTFKTPDRFFARFFVHNYCPLAFMEESGRNVTPDKLPAALRNRLFDYCDEALKQLTAYFAPRFVIGVGGFAEARIRAALPGFKGVTGRIPHPSPANPAANSGWTAAAEEALMQLGIDIPSNC